MAWKDWAIDYGIILLCQCCKEYLCIDWAFLALYCGEDAFNVTGGSDAAYAARLNDIVVRHILAATCVLTGSEILLVGLG